MQEAMIGYYLERDGCLPKQFAPFCDIKSRVDVSKHWKHFGYTHKSGVWLYGSPDEVFYRADNSIVIWDHKSAHPKTDEVKDHFRPQYEVQVTGYGLIAEAGLRLGTVSAGALGYWDLQFQKVIDAPAKFIKDGMLWAAFVPKVFEVEIDYTRIDKLLKEALKIWSSKVPPEGRSKCRDCMKLEALFAIQSDVESCLTVKDQQLFRAAGNNPATQWQIMRRLRERQGIRWSALREIEDSEDGLTFDRDSLAADWEFPGTSAC